MADNDIAFDLSQCAREPIHMPGSIQPEGVLLAADPESGTIEQASANAGRLLGRAPEALIGDTVEGVVGAAAAARLRERDLHPDLARAGEAIRLAAPDGGGQGLLLFAHRHDDVLVLEFEAEDYDADALVATYDRLQAASTRLARAEDVDAVCDIAAREVRAAVGYDHVMIYRFEDDWSGCVVAESRHRDRPSYLDHRFPASDIPEQARALYHRNRLRFVFDTEAAPALLQPQANPRTGRPLDLGHAAYRSISPVHIAYLRNMDVRASLSVSLVVDDRLWGLIACHHPQARCVPLRLRVACEALGETVASHLSRLTAIADSRQRATTREALAELSSDAIEGASTVGSVRGNAGTMMKLLGADALVAHIGGEHFTVGMPGDRPPPDLSGAAGRGAGGLWLTDAFAQELDIPLRMWPALAGGAFLGLGGQDYLCFGRYEQVRSEVWAGDPSKPAERSSGDPGKLSPRSSFEAWRNEVIGRSRPFSLRDRATAQSIREVVLEHRGLDARRAAELAQRRARDLIADVLNNVDAIVHVADDVNGDTLLINDHARELLGDEAEAVIARLALPRNDLNGEADVEDPATGRWFECRAQQIGWSQGRRARLLTAIEITGRKQAEERLRTLATTDELTGTANRRAFMEKAAEELARARRYGRPLSLLMLDIDHFKQVNDNHGHGTGDAALRSLAETARGQLRVSDLLGRLGGEEFATLLPETDMNAAREVAERIRRAIAAAEIESGSGPLQVTVSIGASGLGADGDDIEHLMSRADSALYEAKRAGRNRVVAEPPHDDGPKETRHDTDA
ncbi:MAG: diguanylate cyclase [Acetobacterales bacterium]